MLKLCGENIERNNKRLDTLDLNEIKKSKQGHKKRKKAVVPNVASKKLQQRKLIRNKSPSKLPPKLPGKKQVVQKVGNKGSSTKKEVVPRVAYNKKQK